VTKRDYYEILGLSHGADEQQLKAAYRKLAMQYHPDRNPDNPQAEEKFKEAAEAYGVLSDPQKRAAYDRYGHAGVQGAAGPGFDPSAFGDFSDILGEFFGFGDLFGNSGRRQSRAQRGGDMRYDLEIGFEEAVFGKTIDIQVPSLENCERCKGSGAEPGSGPTACPACRGRGEVVVQQSFIVIRRTCGSCGGSGQVISKPCSECRGQGRRQVEHKLQVSIPAGVDDGTRIRLSGRGQPGAKGGPPGDLYVVLKVREHPFFERQEYDLHCAIPVNVAQAALGAEIEIPTLEQPHKLKIPAGAQSGAQLRLRGQGVPRVNAHGRGDLIAHIEVKIPARLSREQRRLFEELAETLPADNQPAERSVFEKVKDYFV